MAKTSGSQRRGGTGAISGPGGTQIPYASTKSLYTVTKKLCILKLKSMCAATKTKQSQINQLIKILKNKISQREQFKDRWLHKVTRHSSFFQLSSGVWKMGPAVSTFRSHEMNLK